MRDLVIGDPHVTVEDMADAHKLMDLVEKTVVDYDIQNAIFLGDLHNNFAVTNVRVTGFWRERLKRLKARKEDLSVILIKGNHDMLGDGSSYPHALIAYEDLAWIADKPLQSHGTLYLPYYADPNLFLEEVAKYPDTKLIFCHQEFNGAMYDNGFYAPNGVDPKKLTAKVISGHIHTPQTLGDNVWYPGAPRWRHYNDANIDRSIVIIDRTLDGSYSVTHRISTDSHCRKIWARTIEPSNALDPLPPINDKDEYRFRIHGDAHFVKDFLRNIDLRGYKNVHTSTIITEEYIPRVRESDGIEVAFMKYVNAFKGKNGTNTEQLKDIAIKRLYVK